MICRCSLSPLFSWPHWCLEGNSFPQQCKSFLCLIEHKVSSRFFLFCFLTWKLIFKLYQYPFGPSVSIQSTFIVVVFFFAYLIPDCSGHRILLHGKINIWKSYSRYSQNVVDTFSVGFAQPKTHSPSKFSVFYAAGIWWRSLVLQLLGTRLHNGMS